MKTDTHKTKVKFLLDRREFEDEPETVYAYFPEEVHNGTTMTCYAHIGQHSACSPEYAAECQPATPAQYADLKEELESIGYNLEVIN